MRPTGNPTRQIRFATVSDAERRLAFAHARRHSWLVRTLKIVLPLGAVAVVAMLFITPSLVVGIVHPGLKGAIDGVEFTGDQLRMVNPRFEGVTASQGRYVVSAKAAVQSAGNIDEMHMEGVHGHLIEADNSWTDLTSKGGLYEVKKRSMRLTDGIVITTSGNARAELDNADVDIDSKKVTSAVPVVMTMPNGTLKGRGLLIEGDAKRFVLPDAVEAHLIPPKSDDGPKQPAAPANPLAMTAAMSDKPIDVTAKRLEVLDGTKTASFIGSVEAKQSGMTLTAEQLDIGYTGQPTANSVPTTAAGSAQNIRTATALRNVVIVMQDGRKATCDKSLYDQTANSMTLTGTVVLSQGGSVLHADQVVADLTAHKTHVTAADRVTGHFLPAAKSGETPGGMTAFGSASTVTDISANRLDLSDFANEAIFQGAVIVTQGVNHLNGERLAIDTTRRRMIMSGPGRITGQFESKSVPGKTNKSAPLEGVQAVSTNAGIGHGFTDLSASNGQPTKIEADGLTVEDERGIATFNGKVLVVRGDTRISAATLSVFYGGGAANQLSRITAKDHVVVSAPNNQVATGDWLIYEAAKNQLVMGGNVTVSQQGGVVHGEKLVVDLETGESQFDTQSAAGADQQPGAAPKPGRIQLLITPQGIQQIGGPGTAQTAAKGKPKTKTAVSASDVLVAPDAVPQ